MSSNVNNVYILTSAEVTVIAAAKNIKGMFSMQNDNNPIDETAVCYALNHLYQKEFIRNAESEGFVLEDGLRELVTIMEEAKSVIVLRHFAENIRTKVIYVGSRLVVTEQREQDVDNIRIYELPLDEIEDYIQDFDNEEKNAYRRILDEEQLILDGMKKKQILQNDEIQAMGNIVTMVEKMSATGNEISYRMIAKQDGTCFVYNKEEQSLESLNKQEFYRAIEAVIREELDDIS